MALKEVIKSTQKAKDIVLHVDIEHSSNPQANYDTLQYAAGYAYPIIKVRTTTFTKPHISKFAIKFGFNFVPDVAFVINDDNNTFTNMDYPTDSDIVTIYLGNQYDTINKPIHLDFKIANTGSKPDTTESLASKHAFHCELAIQNGEAMDNINEKSTSIEIIKKLCASMNLGLVTNVDSTNDSTIWRQHSMTNIEFLEYVCDRIYVNDETGVKCFIDQYYRLNVIDVNKNLQETAAQEFIDTDLKLFNPLDKPEEVVLSNDRYTTYSNELKYIKSAIENRRLSSQKTTRPIVSTVIKKDYSNASVTSAVHNTKTVNTNKDSVDLLTNNNTAEIPMQGISTADIDNDKLKQFDKAANEMRVNYLLNNKSLLITMQNFSNMFNMHKIVKVAHFNEPSISTVPLQPVDTNLNSSLQPQSANMSQTVNKTMSGDYSIAGMLLTYSNSDEFITQIFKLVKRIWEAPPYKPEEIDLSDAMYGAPEPYTIEKMPDPPPIQSNDGNYGGSNSLGDWMSIARGELGVKEYAGAANNPRIQEYHAVGGAQPATTPDNVPWCGSFVGWCMSKAGYSKSSQPARAISWSTYGTTCPIGTIGAIIVMKISNNPSVTTSGNHVAFCRGMQGNRVLTLGGNQTGNAVTESSIDISKIISWRLPNGAASAGTAGYANSIAATGPYAITNACIQLVKQAEGCYLNAYQDSVGVWTIGYGHTKSAKPGMRITYAQADALLQSDLTFFANAVNRNVNVKLTQSMFDALVSFAFNLGAGRITRSSDVGSLLAVSRYFDAANAILRFNKAGGKVLAGLTKRRTAERQLFIRQGTNPR